MIVIITDPLTNHLKGDYHKVRERCDAAATGVAGRHDDIERDPTDRPLSLLSPPACVFRREPVREQSDFICRLLPTNA